MQIRRPQQPFAVTVIAVENGWHWCVRDFTGDSLAAGLSSDETVAHARATAAMSLACGPARAAPQGAFQGAPHGGTSFSP